MIPLRLRSYYSLLKGTASPAALCRQAKEYGYQAMALTDCENLYGLWAFLDSCKREEIRPIVGAELSLDNDKKNLTLLVRDHRGYTNLCNIITRKKTGQQLHITGDDSSLFSGLVLLVNDHRLLEQCHRYGLDVVADLGNRPTENGSRLRKFAAKLNVPAVCTPDSDMAHTDEQRLRCLLFAVENGTMLSSETVSDSNGLSAACLEKPQTYHRRFSIWPEVLSATEEVAERCGFSGPHFGIVMPPWQQNNGQSSGNILREQAFRGARYRYGDDLSEVVIERLEYELRVIEQMNFSSYFLVVQDIVHPPQPDGSRKHRRVCGRGSGAASLVAYCLGITNVCPIRYNLYFERFLNPGRSDPPDIDIDFAWDERDEILAELFETFGDHAAMVCNHVFFKPRMAIRETARAYGLPGYEISRMTKRLPWFFKQEHQSLQEQIAGLPSLRDQDFSGPWSEIINLAGCLVGLPRYLSVHPGGVVITPQPVRNYVPVERAAKGVPIIQWEKDGTETAGLVKIDLLGNRSLGVIRDAIGNVKRNNNNFSEQNWEPEDDQETRTAVSRGKTMGCFYIESPAMRLLQKKAGSGDFEQLVIQSSIIRPAANEFVREYVRRLHGGTWDPLHPFLENVLDETFGLMVYQEDVSRVAVALGGFSHSDADGLRKVLSKKDRERRLRDYKESFYRGCGKNGLTKEDIDRIWSMMMSFDGYSFCKPHSASYARVSFQSAYLKTHFPAEFMAAVISNQGGYYSTFAYVSEAKRQGLVIEPPDVNESDYRWRGQKSAIRVGLQAVHELSEETAIRILDCRQKCAFRSFRDFLQRVHPAANEVRSLIHAGALDCLNPQGNRSVLLWDLACREQTRKGDAAAGKLFAEEPTSPPLLASQDALERLRREYLALGFLCAPHPISLVRSTVDRLVQACDVATCVGRTIRFAGWLLTGKMVSTKTGEVMEFLTFEDETGLVETTFFPEVYRRYAHILSSGKPFLLNGLVEEDYGALTLTVDRVAALKTAGKALSS